MKVQLVRFSLTVLFIAAFMIGLFYASRFAFWWLPPAQRP